MTIAGISFPVNKGQRIIQYRTAKLSLPIPLETISEVGTTELFRACSLKYSPAFRPAKII
jgi:hypothetical protein